MSSYKTFMLIATMFLLGDAEGNKVNDAIVKSMIRFHGPDGSIKHIEKLILDHHGSRTFKPETFLHYLVIRDLLYKQLGSDTPEMDFDVKENVTEKTRTNQPGIDKGPIVKEREE